MQIAAYRLLSEGQFAGYAFELDEFEHSPAQQKLLSLRNVLATPHTGWYTGEALARAGEQTIANIRAMLAGAPINAPPSG